MNSAWAIALLLFASTLFSGQQIQAAVYTDQDLQRYGKGQGQTPGTSNPTAGRTSRTAKTSSEIFRENERSIAAVVAYDEKGTSFSHGSGFVIAGNGAVLTSYHIISNAASVRVKIGNDIQPIEGILHADREHDIVVLKIGGAAFRPVTIGDSREVRQGDKVFLMDNAQGGRISITEGKANGFREVGGRQMIGVTVPLAAGSSGGALFDQYGEVIGIATSIVTDVIALNFVTPLHTFMDRVSLDRVISLREAFYRDPGESANYWINLGNSRSSATRYTEAIEAYNKAVAADPNAVEVYNGLGVAYMNLKKSSDALAVLRKAKSLDPLSAWTLSNLGMAYLEAKNYTEAAEELKAAVRIMPELAVAHFNLGIAYTKLEQYSAAITAYSEAIRLKPSFVDAHYGLGLVHVYLKNRGAALEEYKILQGLDPALAKKLRDKME